MINEKYRVLIDKLISSTKKKLVNWEQTSSESMFKTNIGLGTITIEKIVNCDINGNITDEFHKLSIINDEGIEADCIYLSHDSTNQDYNLLEELYTIASDSSLKITDTVQSMIDELNKLEQQKYFEDIL